jgi:hypothetical protein
MRSKRLSDEEESTNKSPYETMMSKGRISMSLEKKIFHESARLGSDSLRECEMMSQGTNESQQNTTTE